jgi:hypothetical protein
MRVRLGECSGPIDASIVRTAFDVRRIPVTIGPTKIGETRLHIHVRCEDAVRGAALLHEVRSQDYWTAKELEALEYYPEDRLDP